MRRRQCFAAERKNGTGLIIDGQFSIKTPDPIPPAPLAGGDGDDSISGGEGDDSVTGDAGNDVIDGGAGSDTMIGGEGDDTVDGQIGNDFLFGGLGDDRISGGDGNDTMGSDQGNDTFFGGNGDDQISGGLDDDLLEGGEGNDLLDGGPGRDQLLGGRRDVPRPDRVGCDNDTLRAGGDDDFLDGGRGRDLLDGGLGSNDITADLGRDIVFNSGGINRILHVRKNDEQCRGNGRSLRRPRRGRSDDAGERPNGDDRHRPIDLPPRPTAIRSHEGEGSEGEGKSDLAIVRIGPGVPVPSAQEITYSFTVSNAGPKKAFHVTVYDTVPLGVAVLTAVGVQSSGQQILCKIESSNDIICELGVLAAKPNAVAKVEITGVADANPGTLTHRANVTSSSKDPVAANSTVIANHEVTRELHAVKIEASDSLAGEQGPDTGKFSICRDVATPAFLDINFTVNPDPTRQDDASPGDYALKDSSGNVVTSPLRIPADASCANLVVHPVDDSAVEGTEKVRVRLDDAEGYYLSSPSEATVNIADNDRSRPLVTISTGDSPITEWGLASGSLRVHRGTATPSSLVVNYLVISGQPTHASAIADYQKLSGSVTIGRYDTVADIEVKPVNDTNCEGPETVEVILQTSANYDYDVGSPSSATMTITDNDPPTASITASDSRAGEPGDLGKFTVTLSCKAPDGLAVQYAVDTSVPNAATPGTSPYNGDYLALNGYVLIAPGSDRADIVVTPADDWLQEATELVVVNLSASPANYYFVDATKSRATVSIEDDDGPNVVTVTAIDPNAYEQNRDPGTFEFRRTNPSTSITVNFNIEYPTNATPDTDYDFVPLVGTTVTIPAGTLTQTISVVPEDDLVALEGIENVTVRVVPGAGYTLATPNDPATVTITDNECVPVHLTSLTHNGRRPIYVGDTVTYRALTGVVDPWRVTGTYTWKFREKLPSTGHKRRYVSPWESASGTINNNTLTVTENVAREGQYQVTLVSCGVESNKQVSVKVEPVRVTSIMIQPSPACVGQSVTFTAAFTPTGRQPDFLTWKLTEVIITNGVRGSVVEATGTGNLWSYAPKRSTNDFYGFGASIVSFYEIEATAVSGGVTSTVTKTFEVTPLQVTSISAISVNGGGFNEGELFRYSANIGPAQCLGSANGPGNVYTWSRTRTSSWGSNYQPGFVSENGHRDITKYEVDPGVWQITVQLNSGGQISTATTTVTIEPAKIVGFVDFVAPYPSPSEPGALVAHYWFKSSTGRIDDLDDTFLREWVEYKKFVPGAGWIAPNPFVAPDPFVKTLNPNPRTGDERPALAIDPRLPQEFQQKGHRADIHHAWLPVSSPFQETEVRTTQYYSARYDDAPDTTTWQQLAGPLTIVRKIQLVDGRWQYYIEKTSVSAFGSNYQWLEPPP